MVGSYCILSHCWGNAHFIQLNCDTLSTLQSGIPVDAMPKTFREAIVVTRRLGVRYIWIDSLCIQQDDRAAWAREAGLMHKVYSHSHCNISASAAKDSSEGLFRARQPHLILPTHVEVCVADLAHTSDYVHCAMHDSCFWTHSVSSCTINKRAWVTQERLLAPRILHLVKASFFGSAWSVMHANHILLACPIPSRPRYQHVSRPWNIRKKLQIRTAQDEARNQTPPMTTITFGTR